MVAADLLRMLIVLLMLPVDNPGMLWLLYAALFAESAAGQFFQPAGRAAVPAVVGRGTGLDSANSWTTVAAGVVRLGGGPAGGALYALIGFDGLVLIDAATYLVSAMLIGQVGPLRPTGDSAPAPLRQRIGAGIRFLLDDPVLRPLLVVSSLFLLANGALNVLLVPYVIDRLGGGARETGLLMSALGAGFLLSAYAGKLLAMSGGPRLPVAGCLFAVTGFSAGLFLIPELRSALGFVVLVGLAGGATLMLVRIQLQRRAPDTVLGRAAAAFAAVEMAATTVGAVAGSVLGDRLPFTATVLGALVVLTAAAVTGFARLPAEVSRPGR